MGVIGARRGGPMADLIILSVVVAVVGLTAAAMYPNPIEWQAEVSEREPETRRSHPHRIRS